MEQLLHSPLRLNARRLVLALRTVPELLPYSSNSFDRNIAHRPPCRSTFETVAIETLAKVASEVRILLGRG